MESGFEISAKHAPYAGIIQIRFKGRCDERSLQRGHPLSLAFPGSPALLDVKDQRKHGIFGLNAAKDRPTNPTISSILPMQASRQLIYTHIEI